MLLWCAVSLTNCFLQVIGVLMDADVTDWSKQTSSSVHADPPSGHERLLVLPCEHFIKANVTNGRRSYPSLANKPKMSSFLLLYQPQKHTGLNKLSLSSLVSDLVASVLLLLVEMSSLINSLCLCSVYLCSSVSSPRCTLSCSLI